MATITVSSVVIPQFKYTGSEFKLRIYLQSGFISSAGIPLQPGNTDNNNFYKEISCTLSGTDLTIPSFTIDSTTDGLDIQTARYSAFFYKGTTRLGAFVGFEDFRVNSNPSSQSWESIRSFNFTQVIGRTDEVYSKAQIDRLLANIVANDSSKLPVAGGTMTGQLLSAVGSQSAPGFAFDGDADTGIFRIAANQIGMTGGALGNSATGKAYFTVRGEINDLSGDHFRVEAYNNGFFLSAPFRVQRDGGVEIVDYLQVAAQQMGAGSGGHMFGIGSDLDANGSTMVLWNSPVASHPFMKMFDYLSGGPTFTILGNGYIGSGVSTNITERITLAFNSYLGSHAGDGNAYKLIGIDGSNVVQIAPSGLGALRITPKVGIGGPNSSNAMLKLTGPPGQTIMELSDGTTMGFFYLSTGMEFGTSTNHGFALDTNNVQRINITADGHMMIRGAKEIRFLDSDSSNYVGFRAPATVAADIVYVWPTTEPTAGQQLTASAPSGGVVTLSWT